MAARENWFHYSKTYSWISLSLLSNKMLMRCRLIIQGPCSYSTLPLYAIVTQVHTEPSVVVHHCIFVGKSAMQHVLCFPFMVARFQGSERICPVLGCRNWQFPVVKALHMRNQEGC
ncbi:uncharacterized protein LOC126409688 [Nymphaea colorata]|uniref:uncharacterized protein LOC126409688 n=1 Tax=Nymphaea colorata TaxID=210225 RepID=UPI00214F27A0|nr:uncharacterized protein LOC126409688 [Nymphaea colorata]